MPPGEDGQPRAAVAAAEVPEPVGRVAAAFAAAGRSFYLVGGYTRDLLRGESPKDVDAATDAAPEESRAILKSCGAHAFWEVGEKYGTVAAKVGFSGEPAGETLEIEVTAFRSESYEQGSRKPQTAYGVSLAADLARRDFTVNAIAYDPISGKTVDPHGGEADLEAGTLRAVGDPDSRFAEDPLRMLRAVRFSAKLGLRATPETEAAISRNAASLSTVSRERVRDELDKTLAAPAPPSRAIEALRRGGLLPDVMPELAATRGVVQEGPHHDRDVYGHTLAVADSLPADSRPALKLAALYHDTGKPETRQTVHDADGSPRSTFYGHEELSASKARQAMKRLRYDSDTSATVEHLCREHMRPNLLAGTYEKEGALSEKAVRRFAARAHLERGGKTLAGAGELLTLNRADILGHAPGEGQRSSLAAHAELSARVEALGKAGQGARPERGESPVDGKELMDEFGGSPGPWIGELKGHLKRKVVDGELAHDDRSGALSAARAFMDGR